MKTCRAMRNASLPRLGRVIQEMPSRCMRAPASCRALGTYKVASARPSLQRQGQSHATIQRRASSDKTTPPKTSLPEQLRSIMRLVPHSVVVCTSMRDGVSRALTMSSLTSLTLKPTPLVTFNVKTPSRTLEAIAASRAFNIHVLAGDEAGAAVAARFAGGDPDGEAAFEGLEVDVEGAAPLIREEGVLCVLRCEILYDAVMHGLVRVRDHVIVVGEVLEAIPGQVGEGRFGLAYGDRRYRELGPIIPEPI